MLDRITQFVRNLFNYNSRRQLPKTIDWYFLEETTEEPDSFGDIRRLRNELYAHDENMSRLALSATDAVFAEYAEEIDAVFAEEIDAVFAEEIDAVFAEEIVEDDDIEKQIANPDHLPYEPPCGF